MLDSVLNTFCDNVFRYLTGGNKPINCFLVKKHNENLQTHGDFSFPNSVEAFHKYLDITVQDTTQTLLQTVGKDNSCTDLLEESKNWELPVASVREEKGRVEIFLYRFSANKVAISETLRIKTILWLNLSENASISQDCVKMECSNTDGITSLRIKCVTDTIRKLFSISSTAYERKPTVTITYKSSVKNSNEKIVLCGPVLNATTATKETAINAEEYFRRRQNEMSLIAQHKYGLRMSSNSKWRKVTEQLGESAVIFELLQTKPSSPVKVNFDHSTAGSSKGVAFVLYNCARLQTLLRTFFEKVDQGIYPPLPKLEETNLDLLTQEEEWNLVFNYLLGFPVLQNSCVELNEKVCEFRPHYICNFLCNMVKIFSQYYRRVRILTEARTHLLPVLYARIHMLQALNEVLSLCLHILNIKSVAQM